MIYFSSDIHCYHKNVIKFCQRPFDSMEHMNAVLIERWNAVVKKDDEVWTLGDFSFGKRDQTLDFLSKLNGKHHMVLGNHDRDIEFSQRVYLDSGFVKSIQYYKELKIEGHHVVLFHYGQRVWNKSHYGSMQLYGHSHGTLPPYGKSVDVGVDAKWITGKAEYRPYSWDEIKAYMISRNPASEEDYELKGTVNSL